MRVLIAGGGTGGHVIPALAIADALRETCQAEVQFAGTARGIETRLVPQAGYLLHLISIGQLNQVSWATRLKTLATLPKAIIDCIGLLRRWRPHVVVGVGGYASGPAMLAAIVLRLPTLAFEPNAVPGMVNRLVGKRVSMAAVNFPPAIRYFRQAEVTGIPVRAEFFSLEAKTSGSPPRLLVFGGSQGARALNRKMPEIIQDLLGALPELTVLHQAGSLHQEATEAGYVASGASKERWKVEAFLDDMPKQFALSDLILSRSGASTVAELAAAGKPSLLVPFPLAADDHQRLNAEVMADAGAARMLLENEMAGGELLETLCEMLRDREQLRRMAGRARQLAHPDAARKIAQIVARLSGEGR